MTRLAGRQRLFLALPVPPAAHAPLTGAVFGLTGGEPLPGRSEPPAKWHLTLVFLGAVTAATRDALIHDITLAPLGSAFNLVAAGVGAFPRARQARVLWLGFTEGAAAVVRLQATLAGVAARHGFPPETRPYVPHLTLSRLAPPADVRHLLTGPPPGPVAWVVDRVVLFWSRPGPGGGEYREVAAFPLDSSALPP